MRKWFCIWLALTTGLSACNKEGFQKQIEGNYTGIFYRSSPAVDYRSQQISLHLKDNSFSGESGNARYPAICHGNWEVSWKTINFDNACVWTADFDWTLILDGEFEYELNGNHLKIWKRHGEVTDMYELDKIR